MTIRVPEEEYVQVVSVFSDTLFSVMFTVQLLVIDFKSIQNIF